ncbi:response regulator [Bythopirellula goksoeyrii]|uniref:C2H2-type domain-containing protein n=1 Tax=Bythopirellula goksoeyrii TaxID=1400387 RepID=A0A5B9QA90_9BACT|nr:response regulator [Bythopirellula goksoeyrii]QEG35798.1 hypothetical protein Pr1d_31040 [Bythopirellula goksoeyrii]
MILQNTHHVVDCPICGRPLELQSQLINHEIACGHCRGEFFVYETDDGLLSTANRDGTDLLGRVEQLLCATSGTSTLLGNRCCQEPSTSVSVPDNFGLAEDFYLSTLEAEETEAELLPTAVLVEPRDEVFARLATDMAEHGVRVVRAKSATEALKLCGKDTPVLVVANVDLPDQTGWLLAAKLRFVDRGTRIWLYQTESSGYDLGLVNFLNVDELLDYQGDLFSLSETIVELMSEWCEPNSESNDMRRMAAA